MQQGLKLGDQQRVRTSATYGRRWHCAKQLLPPPPSSMCADEGLTRLCFRVVVEPCTAADQIARALNLTLTNSHSSTPKP
jgi:hypothetical protein